MGAVEHNSFLIFLKYFLLCDKHVYNKHLFVYMLSCLGSFERTHGRISMSLQSLFSLSQRILQRSTRRNVRLS